MHRFPSHRFWAQRAWQLRGGLQLRSSKARSRVNLWFWRQRYGVPWRWCWRRAHQDCVGFTTDHPGSKKKGESEASVSLEWRKLVSRCTYSFGKHRNPWKSKSIGWLSNRNDFSQKQNQKFWDTNPEQILLKRTFLNWIDKLSFEKWKLGIFLRCMNSRDKNKVYFTKSWQIENGHFEIRIRGIHEMEKLKRGHELRVEGKLIQHHEHC